MSDRTYRGLSTVDTPHEGEQEISTVDTPCEGEQSNTVAVCGNKVGAVDTPPVCGEYESVVCDGGNLSGCYTYTA